MNITRDQDTICALATPQGRGAIALVRLSGPIALEIARQVCLKLPKNVQSHQCYFTKLKDRTGSFFDEALVLYFENGKSYTGEETIEFSVHGSPEITSHLLETLVHYGARVADRGEFTYRAFMNGKMDLVQAESVLSLIESQSILAAKQALRQLGGDLSLELQEAKSEMTWGLAHIEASIDFSQEGLETVAADELHSRLFKIQKKLLRRLDQYKNGRVVREGIRIALVGEPNVGKSSLLNVLLEEDRAIVTNIAGTTRDTIDGRVHVAGLPVVITDTAGLRESTDVVEKLGIERSLKALEDADLVLHVFDASRETSTWSWTNESEALCAKTWFVINKMDLCVNANDVKLRTKEILQKNHLFSFERVLFVSSLDKESSRKSIFDQLERWVSETSAEDQTRLFQARHYDLLNKAVGFLNQGLELIKAGVSPELSAFELKESLVCLQEILGEHYDDQILDRVFKEFCLGK